MIVLLGENDLSFTNFIGAVSNIGKERNTCTESTRNLIIVNRLHSRIQGDDGGNVCACYLEY